MLSQLWWCIEETEEKKHRFRHLFVDGEKEEDVKGEKEREVGLTMYHVKNPRRVKRWVHQIVEAKPDIIG